MTASRIHYAPRCSVPDLVHCFWKLSRGQSVWMSENLQEMCRSTAQSSWVLLVSVQLALVDSLTDRCIRHRGAPGRYSKKRLREHVRLVQAKCNIREASAQDRQEPSALSCDLASSHVHKQALTSLCRQRCADDFLLFPMFDSNKWAALWWILLTPLPMSCSKGAAAIKA